MGWRAVIAGGCLILSAPIPAHAQIVRWLSQSDCAAAGGRWEPDRLVVGTTGATVQPCLVASNSAPPIRGGGGVVHRNGPAPAFRGSDISGVGSGVAAAAQIMSLFSDALSSGSGPNPYEEARLQREALAARENADLRARAVQLDQQARALAAQGRDSEAFDMLSKAWALSNQGGSGDLAIYRDMQLVHAKMMYGFAMDQYRLGSYKRASIFLTKAAYFAKASLNESLANQIASQNAALQQRAATLPVAERAQVQDSSRGCASINGQVLCH